MNQNSAGNHFRHQFGLSKTMVCWTRFPTFVTLSFVTEKLTFWMFRNFIQKEHENQWKWSRILRKSNSVCPLDCLKPWFAERVFHFAKSNVSQLENLLFGIQKSRSANHVNTNRNHMLFCRKRKTACIFICICMVCWTRFPVCEMICFPIRKPHFPQSGKRVQQTMQMQMKKASSFKFSAK